MKNIKENYYTQKEQSIRNYMEYDYEELGSMIENPQDIETGCEYHCEDCENSELELIKEALRRKELQEEHLREENY